MSEVNYDECCSVSLRLEFSKFCSKNRRPFIVQKHENKYLECFSLIQKVKIHHNWNTKKKISATVIKSNLDVKLLFLVQFDPSIQILGFGYLYIDTIQLSNVQINGQLDISIFYFLFSIFYLDTWILGFLDTWIIQLFQFPDNGQPEQLGYPSIQISKYPDTHGGLYKDLHGIPHPQCQLFTLGKKTLRSESMSKCSNFGFWYMYLDPTLGVATGVKGVYPSVWVHFHF